MLDLLWTWGLPVAAGVVGCYTAIKGVPATWTLVKGWWTAGETALSNDIAAIKNDIATIKTKLGA